MALGKVRFIRGDALIRRADGREETLKVGDLVNVGDIVRLASASGVVIVEDDAGVFRVPRFGESLSAASMDALPTSSSDLRLIDRLGLSTGEIERVIQSLNGDGDGSSAPAAGENDSVGDWKGVGRLVERIGEAVAPLQFAFSTSRSGPTPEILGLGLEPGDTTSGDEQSPVTSNPQLPAETPLSVSRFTDNYVNGVTYSTSSGLTGLTGDSGSAGSFSYRAGDTITFSIGAVVVGTFDSGVIQNGLLFLQDIAGTGLSDSNSNYVENMAIFLQALDDDLQDSTPGNGVLDTSDVQNGAASYATNINISQAIRDAFSGYVDSVTGSPLNIATSGKEDISRALASVGIRFTRESELDLSGAGENIFEGQAMQHVADTIQDLAGSRAPAAADPRLVDVLDVPGAPIHYNYNELAGEILFSARDLLVGATAMQVNTYDLVVKNIQLSAPYASVGTIESRGNGLYAIVLNPGVDQYDLEGLSVDYRVEDWTVFRDVTSSTIDGYRAHLSAVIADVPEDVGYAQFTLKSTLTFDTDSSLEINFTSELLSASVGYPVAEYADDFLIPIEYSNDGGATWKQMLQVGIVVNELGVPRPTFGFVLGAGSDSVEIRVPIFDDFKIEDPVEFFDAVVVGDRVYNEHIKFGIIDNDTGPPLLPELGINFVSVTEGQAAAVFTVTMSHSSAVAVTVNYVITGLGAVAGLDYVPVSGTLTFNPGQTTATISVPIIDDLIIESAPNPELAIITLSNAVNAVISDAQGTLRIFDNDGPGHPIAVADHFTVAEDLVLGGNLAGNDSPSSNGGNVWALLSGAVNGVVTVLANGAFTYTPNANFNGTDSFTYTLTDSDGDVSTATVSLTVTSVNDAPIAGADSFSVNEDAVLTGSLAGNDTVGGDGGAGVWSLLSGTANGVVTVRGNGAFTYTPDANFNGVDSFTYTLADSDGTLSTATVTLTVTSVNDSPVAVADSFSVNEDAVLSGSLAGNDTVGGDGGAGVWALLSGTANGVVTVLGNGAFTYMPNANFSGADSFTYTLADSDGSLSTATVILTVTSVDDSPTAVADSFSVNEDAVLSGSLAVNDTVGGDGGAGVWSLLSGTANGVVTVLGNGTFTYTPNANFNGTDSFTYALADSDGTLSTATVTLTVSSVNDAPTAVADSFSVNEDAVLSGSLAGNDTVGGDGGAGVWSLLSGTTNGVVTVLGNGAFTYTPNANFNGTDSFSYTLADSDGTLSTATVTLTVAPVNDLPTAVADSFSVNEDAVLTGSLAGNDSIGGDGGAGVWSLLSGATNGVVTVFGNGTFTYTPNANFNGADSFTYTLADSDGTLSTATVTLTVNPLNDPPVADDESFAVPRDGGPIVLDLLNGDFDADGDVLVVQSINGTLITHGTPQVIGVPNGTVSVSAGGVVSFTPDTGYSGPVAFGYVVEDGNGGTDAGAVNGIVAAPGAPVAVADSFTVSEDAVLSGSLATNDVASGDGGNVWSLLSGPANGVVTVASNGTFTYTPNANFNGTNSFTYTLRDSDNDIVTATATITVNSVNDAPTVNAVTATGTEDTVIPVTLNATDVDGTISSFALTSLPSTGRLYLDAALTQLVGIGEVIPASGATLYYLPFSEFAGSVTFGYTATDNSGAVSASSATVTVNVTAVNDGTPVASNDSITLPTGSTYFISRASLLGNDTLFDNAAISGNTAVSGGTLTPVYDGFGVLTGYNYTPTGPGTFTFTYTLTDNDQPSGQTSTATVTLNVVNATDDFATVNESALPEGSGGGVTVATGSLFNGAEAASDITQIVFNSTTYTASGGVIAIATGIGTLVVQATGVSRGNYTYTLTGEAANGAPGSATDTGITQNFAYTKADTTSATLRVTITDDRPVATNMTVEVPESPTPSYNLVVTLDVSGSMLVQGSSGGVKRTNPDGSVEVTTRMQMAQDALGSLVTEYFRQSPDVTVKLIIFADSAQTVGTYNSASAAITAINGLTNPANTGAAVTTSTMAAAYTGVGSGTNYEAALDTTRIQMGTGASGKQNLVYFLSDGVPTVGDTTIGAVAGDPYFDYVQWLQANNIKSYGVGIGGGISDTSYLNVAHNVDAAGDGNEDPAIIVPDINDLGEQLLSTVPQGVGGNVIAGGGAQSQNFGADGGYVKSISIMLDSADPGTVPDTLVTFTFNGTNTITASSSGFLNGTSYSGKVLTLDALKGFVYGTLLFDFTTGDYTYFTGSAASQGDQFVMTSTVIDGDGDLATSVQTISIVDGKPVANDDTDTLLANSTFLEGNVVTGVGTDAGIGIGDQFTAFTVSGDGVDRIVDNAVVTKVNYKGVDFILGTWAGSVYTPTATASGSGTGYTYTISNGKLTWTSTTAAGQQLIFDDSGYYKYTPPATVVPDPSHTVTGSSITTAFTSAPAGITLVGVHTNGTTTTAEGALSYSGTQGVGLNSATGDVDSNRFDTNETLRVSFDAATRPGGVDNPSFVLNVGTVGNLVYTVYDTAGVQIGGPTTVALTATGAQTLTLPSFISVGRVDLQATTSRFRVTSTTFVDALQTVSLTSLANATAGGLTLSGLTSVNAAASVFYDANGAGVTGAASNQLGILESLVIQFNKTTYGAGVQNVSFTATGVDSGFTYTAYGVDGQLLGRVSSNTNAVTIPSEFGYIGKIVIEAPSADNAQIQSVRFQDVLNSASAAAIPEEQVAYTLTDSTGDSDSATLTLNVLSNDYVGTAAGETVNGSTGNDAIAGLGGNDTINGGAGNDVIEGGDGDDVAHGDAGNDIVAGGAGNDQLFGDAGNDVLRGNDGNDTLDGGANDDRLEGGAGNDTLLGGAGADTLLGGAGNEILDGGIADGVSDVFKWELTDRGNPGTPATDTINNFSTAAAGSGGDVLDLRDLLQGENHATGTGNLAQFLSFEFNGSDTIVHVSSTGGFGAGYNVSREDQTITLTGVNLVNGLTNDQLVIQQLLADQKLIVD